jgi:hypothetical protein
MNLGNLKTAVISLLLIAICVAGRMSAHTPNFTPVVAAALFAGFLFRSPAAILLPLSAMLISDLLIGFYDWRIMLIVYASLAVPAFLGLWLHDRMTAPRILGSTISSSVVFFVATNFAVWAFSGMYEISLAGLTACYTAALPFFRYSLAGDFAWSAALLGGYLLAAKLASSPSFALHNQPVAQHATVVDPIAE